MNWGAGALTSLRLLFNASLAKVLALERVALMNPARPVIIIEKHELHRAKADTLILDATGYLSSSSGNLLDTGTRYLRSHPKNVSGGKGNGV